MDEESKKASSGQDPQNPPSLSQNIQKVVLTSLVGLLEAMFDDADDTLFDMAEKAPDNRSQALHFDTMRALRMDRPSILDNFRKALTDNLQGRTSNEGDLNSTPDDDKIELQDMDTLEQSIAITNMAGRGVQLCGQQFSNLKARLSWLRDNRNLSIPADAISPRAICLSFQRSMTPVRLDIETRLLVYKLFDLIVIARLSELFQALNSYLDGQGVPVRAPNIDKPQPRPAPMPAPRAGDEPVYTPSTQARHSGGAGYGSAPVPGFGHAQMAGGAVSSYGGTHHAGQYGQSAYAGGYSPYDAAANPGGRSGQARGARNGRVMGALNALQSVVMTSNDSVLLNRGWMDEQLRDALVSAHPEGGGGNGLPEGQSLLFDLVNTLFNDLLTDTKISNPVKVLLARLEIPVIKIALVDPEFFRRHLHPARELLCEVALLGGRIEDEESPLFHKLKALIETLLREFDQDIRIVERTLLSLRELSINEFRGGLNEKQARHQATNVSTINVAKQAVLRELRYQARGKVLPGPIKDFVLRAWAPHMGLQYAKHGADSEAWRNSSDLLARLIASLQNQALAEPSEARNTARQILLEELRYELGTSRLEQAAIDRHITELESYYEQADAEAELAAAESEEEADENVPSVVVDERSLQENLKTLLAPVLSINSWFQLHTGPEHKHGRWLKVQTFTPAKDHVRFANHRGQVVATKTFFELAEEICDGRSRPIFSNDRKFHKLQADLTFAIHAATTTQHEDADQDADQDVDKDDETDQAQQARLLEGQA